MRRTYINIIRRTLLTLCMMATATMAWAGDVSTADELKAALTTGTDSEVKLTADISVTETIELNENRTITLDLAGHNITATNVRALWIKNGNITISSTGTTGKISVVGTIADNSSVIRVGDKDDNQYSASLSVKEGVTIETDLCYGITIFGKNSKETLVVDGTIKTKVSSAVSGNGSAGLCSTKITIGEKAVISTTNDVAIYHPQSGELIVKGTVEGEGGIEMKSGTLKVGETAAITATGTPSHPSVNNNGTSTSGYAIAIVENGEYAGVNTVSINPAATIDGAIAVVKDSDKKSESPEIVFSDGGLQMTVKVTDKTGKVVGQYISLELAMKDAPAESTIMLMDDCDINTTIETTKDYTLDLNGKTIISAGQRALWIKSGTVTINSTVAGGKIIVPTISNKDQSVIRVGSSESAAAALTVAEDVTISADECYGITVFGTNSETLTVNGNVNTKIRPAISGNGSAGFASTNITIGSTANITTSDEVAIYQPQAGTLTVYGKVTGAGGIEIKGGSLTVGEHATITATGTPSHVLNDDGTSSRGYSIVIVENAQYAGVSTVDINNKATLNGPVAQLKDSDKGGFTPTYSGSAVNKKVAAIGNDEYFTLNDAIAIVPSLGTVKLIDSLGLTSTFEMDAEKTYTFDLNGKTLTGTGCAAVQLTHGHVTIANGTITTTGSTEAIRLGSNDGDNRNITLTINNDAKVTSNTSTGVLLSGTNTRETLEVKGKITTSDHSAIVSNDEVAKIHVANGAEVSASNAVAIHQANIGELVIDGKVTGTDAIKMYGGNLKVSQNATITAASATNYAIAIVEKENCAGVGKANISNEAHITGVIACLVESQNVNAAEPMFNGDITMAAETLNSSGFGEKYAKLTDAIAAAIVSKEVKLLDNITVIEPVAIVKAITLNMDDYSLIDNQTSGETMTIGADVNVTVKNGGITSKRNGISITAGTVALQNMTVNTTAVSLAISGGTVTANQKSSFSSSASNTVALSGGSLTMDGKVLNTAAAANHAITATAGNLTIANIATVSSANSNAINWASAGTLTVEGGKIMGAEAVYASAGVVTINGGTFTGTGNAVNIAGGTPSVTGGTFICGADDGNKPITAATATGFVKGDYFSKKIDQNLCYSGYMVSENPKNNGMYYLVSEIVINDGTDWTVPATSFTIATAKYVRNSGMGAAGTKFGTLCLPFSIDPNATSGIPAGMTFYKVASINSAKSVITLTQLTTTIDAGTPVIFLFNNATTNFEIVSTNASISNVAAKMESNLVGTFAKQNMTTGLDNIYYLNSDAFHQATKSLTVPAFRAYISNPSVSGVKVLNICIDDEVDNIGSVIEENNVESIYDLQGRKQNTLQSGMNIIRMSNGKTIKVMVK